MPRKKATAAKTTRAKKELVEESLPEVSQKQSFFSQYLRFGESYTSLVLGIIVVIIATVLLLSFVQNRQGNIQPENDQLAVTQGEVDNGAAATTSASVTITETQENVTVSSTEKPTATISPTAKPQPIKVKKQEKKTKGGEKMYTVKANDNLWLIAEKTYKSGYNWVDIARVNKLNNPEDIHIGDRLVLPNVKAKVLTVKPETKGGIVTSGSDVKKITGDKYTIEKGDSLWNIAVRAYGDGYQWTKIAKINKLSTNPGLIHVGNTLKIPRK